MSRVRRLVPELATVRSSAVVFAGFSVARLLGFLFSVLAARVLLPYDFGQMSYALALATIASVLLSSSPVGLSRFLARHAEDRPEQVAYLSNWLAVVAGLLAVSLVAAVPIAVAGRLDGWMTAGVLVNLAGIAVLETYREIQRGLGRFLPMTVFYGLANLLQLAAVAGAALAGWRSPALFVFIYGASSLAAWLVMQRLAPLGIGFARATLDGLRLREVVRFARPLLLQSVFFAVWFSADLVFVQWMLSPAATGNYAAAKTLANSLWLAPTAIGMTLVPRVARLPQTELRRYLFGVLALTAAITVTSTALMAAFGRPLVLLAFGDRYPDAAGPLGMLAVGMGLHGLYIILFNLWIGLGRPLINMVSAAAGMVCTVLAAAVLVPQLGLLGAATGFTLGSAVRLVFIAAFTARELRGTAVPRVPTSPMAVPVPTTEAGGGVPTARPLTAETDLRRRVS